MKLRFKTVVICAALLFIIALKGNAQFNINTNPYWNGEIHLTDGSIKTGMVMVPNSSKENYIAFRSAENGKKETIKRKEIKSINVTSPNGAKYFYENVPVVITFSGETSYTTSLLMIYKQNDLAKFYVESGTYKIDPKTNEMYTQYTYVQGKDLPSVQYYIHKRGEENTFILCMTGEGLGGLNSKLRKSAQRHLTEDAALLKRIMDKELGHRDIVAIIDTYLESTKGL